MTTTIKFSDNPTTVDLIVGRHNIYILGGLYVKTNSLNIILINKSTKESIPIFEYGLKPRDFNGVCCFYFDISKTGSYDISFRNYYNVVVKKSMLSMRRLFQNQLDISDIRVKIERK